MEVSIQVLRDATLYEFLDSINAKLTLTRELSPEQIIKSPWLAEVSGLFINGTITPVRCEGRTPDETLKLLAKTLSRQVVSYDNQETGEEEFYRLGRIVFE